MNQENIPNDDKSETDSTDNQFQIKVLKTGEETAKDIISELMTQSLIDEYGTPPNESNIHELLNYYYSRDDSVIYYIEENSEVAGFSWLIESSDVILGNSFVCILYLFVDPKYRGKKYSKILLNKSIDYCNSKNIDDIRLTVRVENPVAIKLYQSMGFNMFKYEMTLKLDNKKKEND